jgi:hypothetical protein
MTVRYKLHVKQPLAIQRLFKAFGAIDHHDQFRQGFLAPEENWPTKVWWKRVFASVWGMAITDAFLALRHCHYEEHGNFKTLQPFRDFCGKLVMQIIRKASNKASGNVSTTFPSTIPAIVTPPPTPLSTEDGDEEPIVVHSDRHCKKARGSKEHTVAVDLPAPHLNSHKYHVLYSNRHIPPDAFPRTKGNKGSALTCRYCPKDCYSHCALCSIYQPGKVFGVCGVDTLRDCWTKHMEEHYH